jgi:hypothetical protein
MEPAVVHVWFKLSHKNGVVTLLTGVNSSRSHVDWCKFRIHLRSLNVGRFGTVAATVLKIVARGHLQWHVHPTEFHENLQTGLKVSGAHIRHAHRQRGDLIVWVCPFKELGW